MQNTYKIEKSGKIFMLAYDQGMEHGPVDFNNKNYHPSYIIKIALNSGVSCLTMQYGIAKQYYTSEVRNRLPLILKLNGKTRLYSKNYRYALNASVEDAKRLGAVGIGFTITPGQIDEHIGFEQFAEIRRQAEKAGLITALWSYARGPEIKDKHAPEVVKYAARVSAELGADIVKLPYTGDTKSYREAVQLSLKTKVIAAGTENFKGEYTNAVKELMSTGAVGLAVGRKIWQAEDPVYLAKKVALAIYNS